MDLSKEFWDHRYKSGETGWDLGEISLPLKTYFDQLAPLDKNLNILIPGGGNSYEAEYLHRNGFNHVHVADLSITALNNIKQRVPSFPESHLINKNFFDIEKSFDLIIEQTFFCAIDPTLRSAYAQKASSLLKKNGKLVGLLFDDVLNHDRPPFGGSKPEYLTYFEPHFEILIMNRAYNSHPKRMDRELFFKVQKKH